MSDAYRAHGNEIVFGYSQRAGSKAEWPSALYVAPVSLEYAWPGGCRFHYCRLSS